MELKQNIFLKYQPYFKHYPFIKNFQLKAKIISNQQYTDGRYDYFGDRVETMRHGQYGIMFLINKYKVLSIYQGSWRSDSYHGKGSLYTISHPSSQKQILRCIQGQWINGILHGKTLVNYFQIKNGKWETVPYFDGQFRHGQKSGFGIQKCDQNLYRGQFNKDCRQGLGRLQDNYGNFFDGVFQKSFLIGESFQSIGDDFIITDINGSKYIYKKPVNSSQFSQNFTSIIHQIRMQTKLIQ